ncbi:phytanoyl-CoA dioxygenase family protein [Nannocystaceae bacterium ST9]
MSELRADFEREGFAVIPGFASPAACEQLRAAATALVDAQDLGALASVFDAKGQRHGEDPWFLDSGGEVRAFLEPERDAGRPRVNKLGHAMHDRLPDFDRFSRDPRLAALVAELGLVDPLLLQSMVIFKHPRVGGEVPAHQDATYLYTEPVSVIGLWFALEPATRDNGCLEVLPGGHRLGLRERYRRSGARASTEVLDAWPWPREGWLAIEAEVGTLVAFHGLLPHRSRANRSDQSRCAYTLHVINGASELAADCWLQRPADMPLRGFTALPACGPG